MKLKFEIFIENKDFSINSKTLFKEAITCYKFSAYRASLIMAYLGFIELIRNKIYLSEIPNGYTQKRWKQDILHKIKNEECWDKEVFELLIRTKDPIFNNISNGLKTQLCYWKDRRNDCAHFKKNNISQCHIEAFFEFIESNLDKFIINDSVESIINEVKEFFTEEYKDKNIGILISKIFVIFDEEMFENFLENIIFILSSNDHFKSKIDDTFFIFGGISEELKIIFLELLIRIDNYPNFSNIFKKIIEKNNELYLDLCEYNNKFYNFIPPTDNILKLYSEDINKFEFKYKENLFKYFIKHIPQIYSYESYEKFLNNLSYLSHKDLKIYSNLYNLQELKSHIFLHNIRKNNNEWLNKHKNFVITLAELLNFDNEIKSAFKFIFNKENPPDELINLFISKYNNIFKEII